MEKKNIFAVALSCSLIWHLLGTQAVDIVWPKKLAMRRFPEINFWGAYLQNSQMVPKTDSPEQAGGLDPLDDGEFSAVEKEKIPLGELSEKKDIEIVFEPAEKDFFITESLQGGFERSVLIKPDMPAYPDWARKLGNYFEMELKFLILPDGTVGTVEKVTSAGYPELDEIGIRYIRQWKFMPLPESSEQSKHWAVIKLVFNLK